MHSRDLALGREGGGMSPADRRTRELAARESDGIHVSLLWHPPRTRSRSRSRTPALETASSSRSSLTAPSMPSTTPSLMPPSDAQKPPPERRTAMSGTKNRKQGN